MKHVYLSRTLAVLCLATLLISSCRSRHREYKYEDFFTHSKFDEDDFATTLQTAYSERKVDSNWEKKDIHKPSEILLYTYQKSEYLPLWVTEVGDMQLAESLVKDLEELQKDGLKPERYDVAGLKKQMEQLRKETDHQLNAVIAFDTACTLAYIHAARDLTFGLIDPKDVDKQWYHTDDTAWTPELQLVTELNDVGKYPSLSQFRSQVPTYELLRKARSRYTELAGNAMLKNAKSSAAGGNTSDSVVNVIAATELGRTGTASNGTDTTLLREYQQYYGIVPSGKVNDETAKALARQPEEVIDIIDANMERIRWMPRTFEKEYIIVDIPLMELFLRRDGKTAMHMNVIVGKVARQTPSLNSRVEHVVFNPPWGVPPTILREDVIPGLERSGEAYLDRKDLKVYDKKGNEVDASMVNASNYKNFVFRQPPGDDNALGLVKFNMPNRWNIYMHDTPHRGDFEQPARAKSSGCIRLHRPQEMAMYILNDMNGEDFDQGKVDGIIATEKTRYEKLKNKVAVHVVYLTAFEDEGNQGIRFLQDIYSRDGDVVNALHAEKTPVYAKR